MNGSPIRQIRPVAKFTRDIDKLEKSHYRKNKKDAAAFRERIAGIVAQLAVDPHPVHSREEPWPASVADPGWEFRKIEFPMPGLRGASGEGRLMYLVSDEEIVPCRVYTHEEYTGRPPHDDLMGLLISLLRPPE